MPKGCLPATSGTIEERVELLVARQLGVDEKKVVPKARLVEDLGADSLDLVELTMALEEEFSLEIPDEDCQKFRTVEDVVRYVQSHVKPQKQTAPPAAKPGL
ncbi:MAG TPA: acyl carrier protein [Terriglobia bacterium]